MTEMTMDTAPRLLHDRFLFDAAFNEVRDIDALVHEGAMFGCPAAFVGRRIAFCVYGSGLGIKLPEARAAALVKSGRAFAFQPYGRTPMSEWVELRIERDRVDEIAPVLAEAIRFARADHGSA
jgi:hypothetical protein